MGGGCVARLPFSHCSTLEASTSFTSQTSLVSSERQRPCSLDEPARWCCDLCGSRGNAGKGLRCTTTPSIYDDDEANHHDNHEATDDDHDDAPHDDNDNDNDHHHDDDDNDNYDAARTSSTERATWAVDGGLRRRVQR